MEILVKMKIFVSRNYWENYQVILFYTDIKKYWESIFSILSIRLTLMNYSSWRNVYAEQGVVVKILLYVWNSLQLKIIRIMK